jgi:formyltetrahydrofolate-dependent phosphoribosylglycinamide formyltransferase
VSNEGITHPIRLAILLSGSGRTLENLLRQQKAGELAASINLVVSNRKDVRGVTIAEEADIPTVVSIKGDATLEAWSSVLFDHCRAANVDFVVMAGFLQLVRIPADFEHRVINIHPSLLPAFGGKGFYGNRVHAAVIEHGCTTSGCTVHFVDNEYDHGPILLQSQVPVTTDDTPESLAARVFLAECEALPEAINVLSEKHQAKKHQVKQKS